MAKKIVKLLTIFMITISTLNAEELTLVSKGQSNYQIVIPTRFQNTNIENFVKLSAKLLQNCVKDSTGVVLPIVKENKLDKSKPGIFLGDTSFARKNGVQAEKLSGWTYVEKTVGKNLILAGNDRPDVPTVKTKYYIKYILGTPKAVTSFLKRDLGVKFLLPGPNGIEVPKRSSIQVSGKLNIKKEPYLKINTGRCAELFYDIANNYFYCNSFKLYGGHSFCDAVPKSKYAKTHPEYFALLGGKRNPSSNHLCISNLEVQDFMYKKMLEHLDKGYDFCEIGQTDGYMPCECKKCEKLYGTSDPGEKLWILHKKMAEKLLKDRPGKKMVILSYGPTIKPPKTFRKFPTNTMIELTDYSPIAFEDWKGYEVPCGFMTYVYNWGQFYQPGLTPKTTPRSIAAQADSFRRNNVQAIYKCGWGELFGLEGPVYYVYGRMFDDGDQDYRRICDEFYKAAYGKAYVPMKMFFDTMYKRLELYSHFLAIRYPAQMKGFSPSNPKPILAFNFSPDVLNVMGKNLQRAEKMADSPKVKKRIELVRKEFEYLKNLASIIHCYNAYKITMNKSSFDNLAALIEKRNIMIDSYYDANGRMRKVPGWKNVRFLGGFNKDIVKVNGELNAPISSPLAWDVANLKKLGVLPGSFKAKLKIFKAAETVSLDGDFEHGVWKNIPFEAVGGIQMGKTRQTTRFKMTYDNKNLYIGFNCTIPDDTIEIFAVGQDGPAWQQESIELFLGPGGTDEFFHLIFNPIANSRYDSVNSILIDSLNPRFGTDDKVWNCDWEYKNFVDAKNKQWNSVVTIPFKSLGVTMPKPGSSWSLNIAREHFFIDYRNRKDIELYLWSPNLETRGFSDRESFGELIF